MRNNTGSGAATLASDDWRLGRSRISWGAVLGGAVVALATTLLLSLLGAAIGAGSIHPLNTTSTDLANYGTGAGIWQIINLILSMALGGYVAARLSGTHSHQDGELHGMTMWAVAVLLGAVLFAHALGGVASMVGQGVGSVMSRAVGGAEAPFAFVPREVNVQAVADRLRQSLGSGDDLTAMSRDQIAAEITALVHSSVLGDLSEPSRNRLIALVAAQSGVARDEAARRVTRMENDAKADLAQVEERARTAADSLARSTATAARALFTALTLGLLSALIGAWLGTRDKRVLHYATETGHDIHAPAYATHTPAYTSQTFYGAAGPSSVSVHDDAGHRISQYLRGVSFPVDKRELLRLARSNNAAADLLHSIEGMAEGRYANAGEVLEALGMAHAP
jgi:hypothetical protein